MSELCKPLPCDVDRIRSLKRSRMPLLGSQHSLDSGKDTEARKINNEINAQLKKDQLDKKQNKGVQILILGSVHYFHQFINHSN